MKTQTLTLLLALVLLTLPTPAPAQWTNDPRNGMAPVTLEPGVDIVPKAIHLSSGRTLIAWVRLDEYKAKYQLLNQDGVTLLEPTGRDLINGAWEFGYYNLIFFSDGEGGAIAVFTDSRDGSRDVYGQRFDSLGNPLWGETGLPLVLWTGNGEVQLKDVEPDGFGGAFISYAIYLYPDTDIYLQRINNQGDQLWGPYGVPIHVDPNITSAEDKIVGDGSGGAIDVWEKYSGFTPHLWAQHFNPRGNTLWGANGTQLFDPQSGNPLSPNHIGGGVPDGSGGAIYTYDTFGNWYLFRLLPTGQISWLYPFYLPDTCTIYEPLFHPADSTIWFATIEKRSVQGWGNYLYHFNLLGTMLFDTLVSLTGQFTFQSPAVCQTSDGVIALTNWQQSNLVVIAASRATNSGSLLWQSELSLVHQTFGFYNEDIAATPDGADGAICAWSKFLSYTDYNVYAQRVRAHGSLGNPLPAYPCAPDYPSFNLYAKRGFIHFSLPQAGVITLELFDLLGRKIQNLVAGYLTTGEHTVAFDQEHLPSGVYLLRLSTSQKRQTIKLVVIR